MPDVRGDHVARLMVEVAGQGRLAVAVTDAEQCWQFAARLAPVLAARDATWWVEQPS